MFQRPPKPQGHWLMGSFSDFQANPVEFLSRTAYEKGDVSCFRMGPTYIYLVNNPELIHHMFVNQADIFYKSNFAKRSLNKLLGNGLVLSDGSFWKRQRKLAQPAFHHHRIASYGEAMVASTLSKIKTWKPQDTLQIDVEMAQLALDIMSKTIFTLDAIEDAQAVTTTMSQMQEALSKRLLAAVQLPDWIPTPNNIKTKKVLDALNKLIFGIIEDRRRSNEDRGDIISMLLLARDEETGEQMSDQQLRDELLTLFIAGHETTANTLTWVWYLIAQHPEIEQKLYEELDAVTAGRTPTFQDLMSLKYNEMVIKESLRMYPPAWILVRQPNADVEVGGYQIKKGTTVFVSPYVTQRDARYYPDPETFMPERFSPDSEKKIPPYAYIPFSGGPRVCIGNSLAMMQMRLIVATIMQQFRLRYTHTKPLKPASLITLVPEGGLTLKVENRV